MWVRRRLRWSDAEAPRVVRAVQLRPLARLALLREWVLISALEDVAPALEEEGARDGDVVVVRVVGGGGGGAAVSLGLVRERVGEMGRTGSRWRRVRVATTRPTRRRTAVMATAALARERMRR